ncbi:hypothetical protein TrRE_jg8797 [Triparma retinervis]|uniref:Uncharacterized protein n=1 Tax=Triparma retinervis TaxID=2557542 RepID=A0A9W7DSX7_9STRA|nr:hypothetical protein TrRE_jg8797 [Triparma retinervis]
MDWRSFRANLVAKERGEASPSTGSRTWAYNAGNVIESGSLIVASTRSAIGTIGFGLRQQYFHKCVMLILDHTKDFTKGLIINRFREGEGPHFGGDVSREKVVLHTSKDEDLRRLSVNVVGDLYMSTVDNVKLAVDRGVASWDSVYVFEGYAGWGPGQLTSELERQSWYMVSSGDGLVVGAMEEIRAGDPREAGLRCWEKLVDTLGLEPRESDYSDLMLKTWVNRTLLRGGGSSPPGLLSPSTQEIMRTTSEVDRLLKMANSIARGSPTSEDPDNPEGSLYVPPGSVVYAARNEHLLSNQYLHKSVVLILSNDPVATVGIVLNRPTPNGIEVEIPGSGTFVLPVLFGGAYKVKTQPGVIWLHNSKALKDRGVGASLGINKGKSYWKVTSKEAMECVKRGECGVEEFVVVSGVSVWTKGEKGTVRGIEGEVLGGRFRVATSNVMRGLWDEIMGQSVLRKDGMYRACLKSEECWKAALEDGMDGDERTMVWGTDVTEEWVGDEGLRNWGKMFMVGFEEEDE